MNPLKILLVDDEEDFLEILLNQMKKYPFPVWAVKSGEEALQWLATNPVDVVVLDVRMPGKDGIATLKEIKQKHPLVEIIMHTGHADFEVANEVLKLGAFDYLIKPIDIKELIYKIQDAYKKKSIEDQKIIGK